MNLVNSLIAYIDPNTGSAIFAIVFALFNAVIFGFRLLKSRLKGTSLHGHISDNHIQYLIYTDDKRYWNVFKPIVEEFDSRGIDVVYWTQSEDDSVFDAKIEHLKSEYIGQDAKSFARLNAVDADIVLSTTPDLDVLQWRRSKCVKKYVHIMHSIGSAAGYRMFGLDAYDAVLVPNQFQIDEIRYLEKIRNLPEKEIVVVGCTYMDELSSHILQSDVQNMDSKCILLAPSWGKDSLLNKYGEQIIEACIATKYHVIIRPHPQMRDDNIITSLMTKYANSNMLTWDFDTDNSVSLAKADIMVSDFSGVVFDFAFVYKKPVIFVANVFDASVYDAAWFDKPLHKFEIYPLIGYQLSSEEIENLPNIVNEVMNNSQYVENREKACDEMWYYQGESAVRTVDFLTHMDVDLSKDD